MGRHDLAAAPRTPAFKRVIGIIGLGMGGAGAAGVAVGDVEEIADATLDASDAGLQRAKSDEGIGYCIFLLAQISRAAKADNFADALAAAGVTTTFSPTWFGAGTNVPPKVTVFDLVSGFSAAVDRHLRKARTRSDISELAQLSATESLSSLCRSRGNTLFGPSLQAALKGLSSQRGFGALAQDFFSRLSRRYIDYHLSRELSNHVGIERRFKSVADHNQFLRELDDHCRLATKPIEKFARDWFSVHNFRDDLTLEKSKGFAAHAIDKLRDAMRYERRAG